MLPLLANQLYVSISEDQLSAVYRSAISKRQIDQKEITIQQDQVGMQACINELNKLIQRMGVAKGTKLHMMLSSDFIRYITLPAQHTFMQSDAKTAYAKAAFREIYGREVDGWHIQCSDNPPNQTTIAIAMDQDLYLAIEQIATNHRLKLMAITPYFAHALNQINKKYGNANYIVALLEHHRLVIANLQDGICQQIRTQKVATNWEEEIAQILARESLLNQGLNQEAIIYAPSHAGVNINLPGWHINHLKTHHISLFKETTLA